MISNDGVSGEVLRHIVTVRRGRIFRLPPWNTCPFWHFFGAGPHTKRHVLTREKREREEEKELKKERREERKEERRKDGMKDRGGIEEERGWGGEGRAGERKQDPLPPKEAGPPENARRPVRSVFFLERFITVQVGWLIHNHHQGRERKRPVGS